MHIWRLRKAGIRSTLTTTYIKYNPNTFILTWHACNYTQTEQHKGRKSILSAQILFFIIDYPQATAAAGGCSSDTPRHATHASITCTLISSHEMFASASAAMCVSLIYRVNRETLSCLPTTPPLCLCVGIDWLFIQRPVLSNTNVKTTPDNSLEAALRDVLEFERFAALILITSARTSLKTVAQNVMSRLNYK